MKKILVPIDGSEQAVRALKEALSYSENGARAELHLLNVQPLLLSGHARMFLSHEQLHGYYEEQGKAALEAAVSVAAESGAKYVSEIKTGPIAETIAEYAKTKGCDHIVMGSRGRSSVTGLLLGSVATKVIHFSTVPVMLVK